MKFDLNWFTTIPGLLITGGVLLLVIALIIFIITSVKGKKAKKNENQVPNAGAEGLVQTGMTVQNPQPQPVPVDVNTQQSMQVPQQSQMSSVDVNAVSNSFAQSAPINSVSPVANSTVNLNASPMVAAPVDPIHVQTMNSTMPEQTVSMPTNNVIPTPDEMIAVGQIDPVVGVETVQPDMPIQTPIISNMNDVPVSTQTPSVEVLTQQMPGIDVVSSVPTVEAINTVPVVDVVNNITPDTINSAPVANNMVNGSMVEYQNINPLVADNSSIETLSFNQPEVIPTVTPVENIMPTVSVTPEISAVDNNSNINNVPINNSSVSIYGGVSPMVPNVSNDLNQPHQIYGGANPLENTQSVPVVNIANGNSYVAQENVMPSQQPEVAPVQYAATNINSAMNSVQVAPVAPTQFAQAPNVVPMQQPQQVMPQYEQPTVQQINSQPIQ